jgi:glycosyltransferase involved in cell wall biosynthesis
MTVASPHKSGGMKKVLIITYYWPPSGGAGVQRWLKFVKYLREFGWEPIVYTPENPEPPDFDESLVKDIPENLTVIKRPVWEPYNVYKYLTGQKKGKRITHGFLKEEGKESLLEKFSVWVRGNFFIPDARRFWIKPSVRFLVAYLRSNPVDAIVSTGPPHSMHLIALGVKKKLAIPWLADFRDPWTEIDFFYKLRLSGFAENKHRRLEKSVLTTADTVVTVSDQWADDLNRLGATNTRIITNGYDPDDFAFLPVPEDEGFVLTHIGSLNADRNPAALWEVISGLCSENKQFNANLKLRFIGRNDVALKKSLEVNDLIYRTEFIEYMPHEEVLRLAARSSALLLLLNNTPNKMGIIPGKTFEYLALRMPILCIGPTDGASARIIEAINAGTVCDFQDKSSIREAILFLFEHWLDVDHHYSETNIEAYSRKKLTGNLVELLNLIL